MKYLDGIKNDKISMSYFARSMFGIMDSCMRLTIRPVKHIDIIYYKPLGTKLSCLAGLTNSDNLKWIDGQPYELITIGGNK